MKHKLVGNFIPDCVYNQEKYSNKSRYRTFIKSWHPFRERTIRERRSVNNERVNNSIPGHEYFIRL